MQAATVRHLVIAAVFLSVVLIPLALIPFLPHVALIQALGTSGRAFLALVVMACFLAMGVDYVFFLGKERRKSAAATQQGKTDGGRRD